MRKALPGKLLLSLAISVQTSLPGKPPGSPRLKESRPPFALITPCSWGLRYILRGTNYVLSPRLDASTTQARTSSVYSFFYFQRLVLCLTQRVLREHRVSPPKNVCTHLNNDKGTVYQNTFHFKSELSAVKVFGGTLVFAE